MTANSEPVVLVVVKAWPRISTTFIAQELVGLEREGIRLRIAAMRGPEKHRHALHDALRAPVHHLAEPWRRPLRVIRAWKAVRRMPGYAKAAAMLQADLARRPDPERFAAFLQALVLVAEMPGDVGLIYAHFIHSVGSLSRYAAAITGLPLVASAHAKDIWTTPDWDKRDKLAAMLWCATCTTPGAEHLRMLADDPAKIHLIHHGLSFARFPADPPARPPRDGRDPADPVRLLAVGRAVEKKGFDDLLDALARLPDAIAWRLDHVGGGPLLAALKARAHRLGLDDRIAWHGIEDQAAVIDRYRAADLFVLPSREAENGDRDGLPNVLMEAQSQALACLSTRFSAIPELIEDGATGLLVPPHDTAALTGAIGRLIADPALRGRIGMGGFARVRTKFRAEAGIARIAMLLRAAMATQDPFIPPTEII